MNVLSNPRPGVWGKDARPGEIIEVLPDGTRIFNLGASFLSLTGGRDPETRRMFGYPG